MDNEQISPLDQYLYVMAGHESGHNPQNVNPITGAYGLFQFIPSTWDAVRNAHPELNLPESVRMANEDQQTMAARAFTADNARVLQANGIPINGGNLYMAHFLGAGGAVKFMRTMQTNPNATFAQVFPDAARANPTFANMTLSQVYGAQAGSITGQGAIGLRARTSHLPYGDQSIPMDSGMALSPRRSPLEEPSWSDTLTNSAQAVAKTLPKPEAKKQEPAQPQLAAPAAAPPIKAPSIKDLYASLLQRKTAPAVELPNG